MKQEMVDKEMRIDTANKLVIEYKTKVNELQKRIIELETRSELHETKRNDSKNNDTKKN